MALNIKYITVFNVPVAPDGISQGTVSLASLPVITGDFVTNLNLSLKTYTFDLKGISEAKALEIIEQCNANTESLALGDIDIQSLSGQGIFTYFNANCLPFSYQDGGRIKVGSNNSNFSSFQVTCITDQSVASL